VGEEEENYNIKTVKIIANMSHSSHTAMSQSGKNHFSNLEIFLSKSKMSLKADSESETHSIHYKLRMTRISVPDSAGNLTLDTNLEFRFGFKSKCKNANIQMVLGPRTTLENLEFSLNFNGTFRNTGGFKHKFSCAFFTIIRVDLNFSILWDD